MSIGSSTTTSSLLKGHPKMPRTTTCRSVRPPPKYLAHRRWLRAVPGCPQATAVDMPTEFPQKRAAHPLYDLSPTFSSRPAPRYGCRFLALAPALTSDSTPESEDNSEHPVFALGWRTAESAAPSNHQTMPYSSLGSSSPTASKRHLSFGSRSPERLSYHRSNYRLRPVFYLRYENRIIP